MSPLLNRPASLALLTLVLFLCSVSCGRQSEANNSVSFPSAYVQGACGPTDGPALEFYFTLKQSQNGKYDVPFLLVQLSENLPTSAPQSYSIKSGKWGVLASRCLKPGQCEAATFGSLHLAKFSPQTGAAGDYELHFQDGSVERGSFDAEWYAVKNLICG